MSYSIESTLSSKERSSLDENQFGLPDERKYPLIDKKHVQSAISYFFKCPEKDRHELALNIQKAAKKFGVEIGEETQVAKYLNMNTEESWNSYALEMVAMIEYSDEHIVLEQSKVEAFFSALWKAITTGFRTIGKIISSMASWIWDRIQGMFKKLVKKDQPYIEVPKIFTNLRSALPIADSVASDVSAACRMLTLDLQDIVNRIDDKKFIVSLSSKSESWRMTMLSFMKNSGICYQKTNLSIGDSAVQKTTKVSQTELTKLMNDANKTVKSLNISSRDVIKSAKSIDDVGDKIKHNYHFFELDARKAFGEYASSGKNLIAEAIRALNMTSESIQKVINLTNMAIAKQVSQNETSEK